MKYAHLADLHLGSWREPKMRDLSTEAFLAAMDQCIENKVDFIIFAGDIFNTSLPSLDTLKIVTKKLKELKDNNIPLYVIAGSHDFSPSGKTMIDVLENAGLLKNVCHGKIHPETKELHLQFTTDPKTNTKITGILGRKGQLDKTYYQNLHLENLEQESGYKIFMFHTTLSEMKPKHLEKIESQPASFLPKQFNYYAGGHIHHPTKIELEGYGTLTYPGALFPNNFSEVEKYSHGGYYLITVDNLEKNTQNNMQKIEWIPVKTMEHHAITTNCNNKSPEVITFEILNHFEKVNLQDTLTTIRLTGTLAKGKVSDINFSQIFAELYNKGAYFVMKNTAGLQSEEFEEIKISASNPETMEEEIIKEHLQQNKLYNAETELLLTKTLLNALTTTKKEGETLSDFQERVIQDMSRILQL
ncbi:MAG: exonuclease SbcCD subunit D [Nanoarchaeota archaeon]